MPALWFWRHSHERRRSAEGDCRCAGACTDSWRSGRGTSWSGHEVSTPTFESSMLGKCCWGFTDCLLLMFCFIHRKVLSVCIGSCETLNLFRRFRENAFMLLEYFSRSKRAEIRHKALTAIGMKYWLLTDNEDLVVPICCSWYNRFVSGHFCATYSEYLTRPEVKNIYLTVLGIQDHEYLTLKIQTLKNLELFLLAEEKKLIKSNENCKLITFVVIMVMSERVEFFEVCFNRTQ